MNQTKVGPWSRSIVAEILYVLLARHFSMADMEDFIREVSRAHKTEQWQTCAVSDYIEELMVKLDRETFSSQANQCHGLLTLLHSPVTPT